MADTTSVGVNFVAQTQDALGSISSLENGLQRLASMGKTLGIIGAGILIGSKISGAFNAIISNGETAEMQIARLTSAFTELSGKTGIPAAKLAMDEYQKAVAFAAKTPFDVQSVVNSAVAMRSQGVDPLTASYKNLAGQSVTLLDVMGNTATSAQEFNENMLAFTSASQGMMGVTVLARRLNMPVAELSKGLNGLTPSTEEWRNQLIKNIAVVPRFQVGMDLASKTISGIKSNIEDMGDQFITAMADIQNSAGIFGKVKEKLAMFGNWLAENGDKLKFFAKVTGMVLGQLFDIVWAILTPVKAVFQVIGSFMVGVQDSMTKSVEGIAGKIDELGAKMRAMATFSERLSLYIALIFGGIKSKIESFYAGISKVMDFLGIDALM